MDLIYDLAIIGGGINGVAIARDASLRGLKVIVLEQACFGSGTSSKTSKLAHGGLRYLEQFEFSLVKESIEERDLLLKNASHRVKPMPFIFPVYKGDKRPLWQVKTGLKIYDFFARNGPLPSHEILSIEETIAKSPGLKTDGLTGSALYYDAQVDDHRLLIDIARDAELTGATLCPHHRVDNPLLSNGQAVGLEITDKRNGTQLGIQARQIIDVRGPWSDPSLVRPTKGAHIIVPQIYSDYSLILPSPIDKRIFFVMPWYEHTLIGTTDTDFNGNPSDVCVTDDDIDYLLKSTQVYLPDISLDSTDILHSFAGLRPLARSQKGNPSQISREEIINRSESGIIHMVGGKYTTHRRMAQRAVDLVLAGVKKDEFGRCVTKTIALASTALTISQLLESKVGNIYVAHRGSQTGDLIENTIPAFEKALKDGADMIEFDVQIDAKNSLWIHHDDSLDRLFDVEAHSIAPSTPINKIDMSSIAPLLGIPSLDEVLDKFSTNINYYCELKVQSELPKDKKELLVEACLASIDKRELDEHIVIMSFDLDVLEILVSLNDTRIKSGQNEIKYGINVKRYAQHGSDDSYYSNPRIQKLLTHAAMIGADIDDEYFSDEDLRNIARKRPLIPYTVSTNTIKRAQDVGAVGYTVNQRDVLDSLL